MLISVYKKWSDFKKRLHIFENVFYLSFIPVSADDFVGTDFKSSSLSFDVIGNKNAHTVKQLICTNGTRAFLYLNFKTFNRLYGAGFQPFFNDNRLQDWRLIVLFDLNPSFRVEKAN